MINVELLIDKWLLLGIDTHECWEHAGNRHKSSNTYSMQKSLAGVLTC